MQSVKFIPNLNMGDFPIIHYPGRTRLEKNRRQKYRDF